MQFLARAQVGPLLRGRTIAAASAALLPHHSRQQYYQYRYRVGEEHGVAPGRMQHTAPPHPSESFLSGTSSNALETMEEEWEKDPSSVPPSWQKFFEAVDAGLEPGKACAPRRPASARRLAQHDASEFSAQDSIRIFNIIRSYRVLGHFKCELDPLRLERPYFSKILESYFEEIRPEQYGFDPKKDMDREFYVGDELPGDRPVRTLREVVSLMETSYCGTVGVQYMHLASPTKKRWFQSRFEQEQSSFSRSDKLRVYRHLAEAELFETFLAKKYKAKRFGLDGGEAMVPGLKTLVNTAAQMGVECVVMGMPHRGRLNVLCNILDKPLTQLFNEFRMGEDLDLASSVEGTGDVKYHLGTSNNVRVAGGQIHISMAANPSHLEAVNPVVEGKTRAKQMNGRKQDFNKAMAVLIHGDAAFAGQGVVAETLELAGLRDFNVGGTVHVVCNNQIGFTTVPKYARSSPYPTEIARGVGAPVIHVNGDDIEAVIRAFQLAAEYRQQFHSDVVLDLVCYRRYGHNELDEPKFTQPNMYAAIDKHKSPLTIYQDKLLSEGIDEAELESIKKRINDTLEEGYKRREEAQTVESDWLESKWHGFKSPAQKARIQATAVEKDMLERVGQKLLAGAVPDGFKVHKRIARRLKDKEKMLQTGKNIDWSTAELLAYGTLLDEGFGVRLCGQDCERGTFSHRHAVLYDQETEEPFTPLDHVSDKQGFFEVINSSLSENAVLGFEHGYSLENPNTLVLWEAQFGDFANGAQVIIDTFIAAGEQKWQRMSGLTMLLPHGFEGQGPEHSSARLERYLQAVDDHPNHFNDDPMEQHQKINLQVANVTTPANFFHLLRRQLHREFRKPLVVMTPKRLLGYPRCVSDIEDFLKPNRIQRIIPEHREDLVADDKIKRVIFCSGHIWYELTDERDFNIPKLREAGEVDKREFEKETAIVRIEEIAPFPYDLAEEALSKYPNAEVVWAQEEPMNMGAWFYTAPRLETADRTHKRRPRYIGRNPAASPATGFMPVHKKQLREIFAECFNN